MFQHLEMGNTGRAKEVKKEQPVRYPGRQLKKVLLGRNNELWQMLLIGKIRTGRGRWT